MSQFIEDLIRNPTSRSPGAYNNTGNIDVETAVNSKICASRLYEPNKALRPQTANRAFKKRSAIRIDKEQLHELNIGLKKESNLMKSDITKLKAKICHLEGELNKMLKESLDRDYKNPKSIVKELKIKYLDLKTELEKKNSENLELKKNLKNSKIQECEAENQALNQECIRLKRLLQDFNQGKVPINKETRVAKPAKVFRNSTENLASKVKKKTNLIKKLHGRINDLEKYLKRSYDGATFRRLINDDIALSKDHEQIRLQLENEIKINVETIGELNRKIEEWKKKAEDLDKNLSDKSREFREIKEYVEKNINHRKRFPPKLFKILNFLVYNRNITVENLLLSLFMNELVTLEVFYKKIKELYPKLTKKTISDVNGFITKDNKISLKKLQDWFNQFIYEIDEELSDDESSEISSTKKEIYTQTEDTESILTNEKSSDRSNKSSQSLNRQTSKLSMSQNPSEKNLPFANTLEIDVNQTGKDEGMNLEFMIERDSPQFSSPTRPEPMIPAPQVSQLAQDDEQVLKFDMVSSPVLPKEPASLVLPQVPALPIDKPASSSTGQNAKPDLETVSNFSIKPLQSPSNNSPKPNEHLQRLLKHFLFRLQINNIPRNLVISHLFPGKATSHFINPEEFELKLQSNSFSFIERDSRTLSNYFFNHQPISQTNFDKKLSEVLEDWEILQVNETSQAEEDLFRFFSVNAGKIDRELREIDKSFKGFVGFKQFFTSLDKANLEFPLRTKKFFELKCYKIDYQFERVPYVALLEMYINMERSKEQANEIKDRTIEYYIKALAERVLGNNIQPRTLFASNEEGLISPGDFIQGMHKVGFGDISHEDLNILIDELSSSKSEEHFIKLKTLESLIKIYGCDKNRYFEDKKQNESVDCGKISEMDSFDFESYSNTPLYRVNDSVLK